MTNTIIQFFKMGGYGFYVWLAYGITASILVINAILVIGRKAILTHSIKSANDPDHPRNFRDTIT